MTQDDNAPRALARAGGRRSLHEKSQDLIRALESMLEELRPRPSPTTDFDRPNWMLKIAEREANEFEIERRKQWPDYRHDQPLPELGPEPESMPDKTVKLIVALVEFLRDLKP